MSPFTDAADAADPGAVLAASTVPAASALLDRFWAVAEEMAVYDADAGTLADAMDMTEAESEVVEAARAVEAAQGEVAAAQAELAAAQDVAEGGEGGGVAGAEEAVAAAQARAAAARARLEEALHYAAQVATRMRANLQSRHGGIAEAVNDAPQESAERDYYAT